MEKNTFTIDLAKETVTLCHETKTLDGKILCETTFDISGMKASRRLKRIADAEVISWRARTGIKNLTTAEAIEKGLQVTTVDTSKTIEKVKHVETAEEKKIREVVTALMAGKNANTDSLKDLMAKAQAILDAKAEEEAGEDVPAEETA
jgi:hypothetical protein